MKDYATIVLYFSDGSAGRMLFGKVRDPESAKSKNHISTSQALAAGFEFDTVGRVWVRQPTQALVNLEISRTIFFSSRTSPPVQVTVTSWTLLPDGHSFEVADHRWAAAWTVQGVVDIGLARLIRKKELILKRNALLKIVRDNKLAAEEDKKTKTEIDVLLQKAKDLRDIELTIDALLAPINDLVTLGSYEPPVFTGL